jgi:hypothetical protein
MSRPSLWDGLEPGERECSPSTLPTPFTPSPAALPETEADNWPMVLKTFGVGLAWAVGFDLLHRAVPVIFKDWDWWKRLPDSKARYEARAYITSWVHHLIAVPFSAWSLWRDAVTPASQPLSYAPQRHMLAFSTGYFLADTYFARKSLLKAWDYSIHHVFAIALSFRAAATRGTERFVSHFLIGEATTILLNLLWVLRKIDAEDTVAYKVTGGLFALLYGLIRVYWFPFFTYKLFTEHPRIRDGLGPVSYTMIGVCGLQFFWYYRILRKFAPIVTEAIGLPGKGKKTAAIAASPKEEPPLSS